MPVLNNDVCCDCGRERVGTSKLTGKSCSTASIPACSRNAVPPFTPPRRRTEREKRHWGARKIRELLVRSLSGDVGVPAKSTIHAVLDRHGLVRRMSKRRNRATGTPLSQGAAPNDLWGADYKGEFVSATGLGVTLTVTNHASRFVLLCEAMQTTREELALIAFERLFAERGLPLAIRSDNGVPCSCVLEIPCAPRAVAMLSEKTNSL